MAITTRIIERPGDEKSFIKAFIHALSAADSRITCSTTDEEIDLQFSSTERPVFAFDIDGIYTLTFTRKTIASQSANRYEVTMRSRLVNSAAVTNEIYFSNSNYYSTQEVKRTFNFRVIAGTKALIIIVANYDNNIPAGPVYFIQGLSFRDGTNVGFSTSTNGASGTSVMGNYYYINEDYVLPVDRLPYFRDIENTSSIELIKSKVMRYGSQAVKHSQTTAFYDCSGLVFTGKEFSIEGSRFYALNANTIFQLS